MMKSLQNKSIFHHMTLTAFLGLFLLALFRPPVVLAETLEEGAKREGKLMFYSNVNVPNTQGIMGPFQKKYPFLKAEFFRGTAGTLMSKVMAEQKSGHVFADVIGLTVNFIDLYRKEGIMGKYVSPEAKALDQSLKDPEGHWTAYYVNTFNFIYNTKMIAPKDLPKTYDDFLQPGWKGKKIGLSTNDVEWYMGMLDYLGEEKGRQFMARLAEQELVLNAARSVLGQLMVAREFPLMLGTVEEALQQKKVGAPVDLVPLSAPTLCRMNPMFLHANAPHPNAAKLLVDFILSKEGQGIMTEFSRIPVRTDIQVDPVIAKIQRNAFVIKPRKAELVASAQKEWNKLFKKR